jgi:hypothetical protein
LYLHRIHMDCIYTKSHPWMRLGRMVQAYSQCNRLAAGRTAQLSMLSTSAPKDVAIKARLQSANFANRSRRPRVIGLINKCDKHPCRNIHVTQSLECLVSIPSWSVRANLRFVKNLHITRDLSRLYVRHVPDELMKHHDI